MKNIDSEHLLGDDLKKSVKKAKTSNDMFKKSTRRHSGSSHSKFKYPPADRRSDEEESDRDAGAQNNQMVRDAGAQQTSNRDTCAQQTENMAADAQHFGQRDVITPKIIRSRANDLDPTNNKRFDNVDGLLQHTGNNARKHSATSSSPQRDRIPPLQMSQEILHQLGDEMGMNVDESKNTNQGLSTQLMHSFLHASSKKSLNKIMKLYALKTMKDSSLSKKKFCILFKTMWQKH